MSEFIPDTDLSLTMLSFLDERIKNIIDRKAMWGSNESVEGQVLQLLDVRNVLLHPKCDRIKLSIDQLHKYVQYLDFLLPATETTSLAERLKILDREHEFESILGEFVRLISLQQIEDSNC